jgi:tetratricopeptide (TPR) repeat protein
VKRALPALLAGLVLISSVGYAGVEGMTAGDEVSLAPTAAGAVTATSHTATSSAAGRKLAFWQARAKRDPLDYDAQVRVATAQMELARETGQHRLYADAEQVLRHVLARSPDHIAARGMLAFALNAQHQFNSARATAERVLELSPHDSAAWAALGDAALELGELEVARAAYERVLAADRGLFGLKRWANYLSDIGDEQQALDTLAEAAAVGARRGAAASEIARCFLQRGEINYQRGRYTAAAREYQQALSHWQGYLPLEHLAEIRAVQGDYQQADALYAKATALVAAPEILAAHAGVKLSLGLKRDAALLNDRAEAGYREAIADGDTGYYRLLALFLNDVRGRPQDAIEFARLDVSLRADPTGLMVLAWIQQRAGLSRKATATVELALEQGMPRDAISLLRAGTVLMENGDRERGSQLLRAAREINPVLTL